MLSEKIYHFLTKTFVNELIKGLNTIKTEINQTRIEFKEDIVDIDEHHIKTLLEQVKDKLNTYIMILNNPRFKEKLLKAFTKENIYETKTDKLIKALEIIRNDIVFLLEHLDFYEYKDFDYIDFRLKRIESLINTSIEQLKTRPESVLI